MVKGLFLKLGPFIKSLIPENSKCSNARLQLLLDCGRYVGKVLVNGTIKLAHPVLLVTIIILPCITRAMLYMLYAAVFKVTAN